MELPSEDRKFLICHMISKDHMFKGCDFMGESLFSGFNGEALWQ